MAKAKQHKERLLSGGKLDNVIKDYMWRQKYHYQELMVMKQKGQDIFDKNGLFRKIVPVMARVYNPKTGKVEEVNIREHNKRVFSNRYK